MSAPRLLDLEALPGRLALSVDEAAQALGLSRDTFERRVLPELRVVKVGRRRIVPVAELAAWLDLEAAHPLDVERRP